MTDLSDLDDRTLLQRASVQLDEALTSPDPKPRAEAAYEALEEWSSRQND